MHATLSKTIAETPIADARWQKKHVHSIAMNYARAPYIEWFHEQLKPLVERDWMQLADLNIAVTEWLFSCMGVNCKRVRASDLQLTGAADELVMNICEAVGAKVYVSGQGARAYNDEKKFQERGIELRYQEYRNQPYPQCHPKTGFVPDLSALDMVLNLGPGAGDLMRAGRQSRELTVNELLERI